MIVKLYAWQKDKDGKTVLKSVADGAFDFRWNHIVPVPGDHLEFGDGYSFKVLNRVHGSPEATPVPRVTLIVQPEKVAPPSREDLGYAAIKRSEYVREEGTLDANGNFQSLGKATREKKTDYVFNDIPAEAEILFPTRKEPAE